MKNARQKRNFASFCRYFPRENCHITKKNTVCNSVGDYLKIFKKNLFKKTRK